MVSHYLVMSHQDLVQCLKESQHHLRKNQRQWYEWLCVLPALCWLKYVWHSPGSTAWNIYKIQANFGMKSSSLSPPLLAIMLHLTMSLKENVNTIILLHKLKYPMCVWTGNSPFPTNSPSCFVGKCGEDTPSHRIKAVLWPKWVLDLLVILYLKVQDIYFNAPLNNPQQITVFTFPDYGTSLCHTLPLILLRILIHIQRSRFTNAAKWKERLNLLSWAIILTANSEGGLSYTNLKLVTKILFDL
jgi:hypothetical protein